MHVELSPGTRIPEEWSAQWRELLRTDRRWRSPFWRPELIEAFAQSDPAVEVARISMSDGTTRGFLPFRRDGRQGSPAGDACSDLHGVIADRELTPAEARTVLERCGLASFRFHHLPEEQHSFDSGVDFAERSLSIDLAGGLDRYREDLDRRGSGLFRRMGQRLRKLEREVGTVELRESRAPDDLDRLFGWKRFACRRKGWRNLYDRPAPRQIFGRLLASDNPELGGRLFLLDVASRPIAGLYLLRSGSAWHAWMVAHDPTAAKYSPGLAAFVKLIERAEELGLETLDLSRGEERFKQELANRSALVSEGEFGGSRWRRGFRRRWLEGKRFVGQSPFGDQARRWVRALRRFASGFGPPIPVASVGSSIDSREFPK
ncbi:MAG TPA: GNAT family N-acetyltransferase [Pirellulaceae bacterium]|nr:GNAT family N-acetyltransferase [Pirellulaceae bacterium]